MKLTIAQAAKQLGISENAVRNRIKRRTLKAVRHNGRVHVVIGQGAANLDGLQEKVRELELRLAEERQNTTRLFELLSREQVLRQAQQATLDRLTETRALAPPAAEGRGELHSLVANLRRRRSRQ